MKKPLSAQLWLLLSPAYQFAFLIVSSFSGKLLHLYSHRTSLPIVLWILYLPTFLLQDALLLICGKALLYRHDTGRMSVLRKLLGGITTAITALASASQISFYLETGGEVQWVAASTLVTDPAGLNLLLSGFRAFGLFILWFVVIAWLITPRFYNAVENFLGKLWSSCRSIHLVSGLGIRCSKTRYLNEDEEGQGVPTINESASSKRKSRTPLLPLALFGAICVCVVLQIVRPRTGPYAHMSGTLPFTLIQALLFRPVHTEFCLPRPIKPVEFPFEDGFSNASWEPAHGAFPGWMPQSESCQARRHHLTFKGVPLSKPPSPPPGWWRGRPDDFPPPHPHPPHHRPPYPNPPPELMPGDSNNDDRHFERKKDHHGPGHKRIYDPSCDPLRITNLDQGLLTPIEAALKSRTPAIKHVVLLTLESTRKDLFPILKGSNVYESILASYGSREDADELDEKLARLSPVARILTGESTGFNLTQGGDEELTSPPRDWKNSIGGINVGSAMTGSAYTLKSLLGSHCGVEPLPVDFTEEVNGDIYQPCIAQILDTFNRQQENNPDKLPLKKRHSKDRTHDPDYLSSPWESVFVQSSTDRFDSQDVLDRRMGFKKVLVKSTLLDPSAEHYPPKQPESNYFGFPETEVLPYLRDLFTQAERNNKRLFLSHLTSSTHHPYRTPKSWTQHEDYLQRWGSEDPLNRYLNAVKYQDDWIGTIFDLLEDTGVINETLVVLVGDHGMAFDVTDGSSTAYNNGHISNFNVPLLFVHPQLPRVQVSAKTTSISILPTILDLLISTNSLNTRASETATRLINQYQGQSLIRTFVPTKNGRQPWYFGIIAPGGSMLAASSAAAPWRLILPLCTSAPFRFTNIETDPAERSPIEEWTIEETESRVRRLHGEEAAKWLLQAEKLARWWFWEQRERWGYHKAARSTARGPEDRVAGRVDLEHWWET